MSVSACSCLLEIIVRLLAAEAVEDDADGDSTEDTEQDSDDESSGGAGTSFVSVLLADGGVSNALSPVGAAEFASEASFGGVVEAPVALLFVSLEISSGVATKGGAHSLLMRPVFLASFGGGFPGVSISVSLEACDNLALDTSGLSGGGLSSANTISGESASSPGAQTRAIKSAFHLKSILLISPLASGLSSGGLSSTGLGARNPGAESITALALGLSVGGLSSAGLGAINPGAESIKALALGFSIGGLSSANTSSGLSASSPGTESGNASCLTSKLSIIELAGDLSGGGLSSADTGRVVPGAEFHTTSPLTNISGVGSLIIAGIGLSVEGLGSDAGCRFGSNLCGSQSSANSSLGTSNFSSPGTASGFAYALALSLNRLSNTRFCCCG